MPEDWEHGGFGLYIHWPFCQAKCPYCDFNSHVAKFIDQDTWKEAYLSEIDRVGAQTPDRVLRSVFFGGGTPSLMHPDVVDAILTRVRATWRIANDIEITLEANPTSVEAGRFKGYRDAGVNRVSMGIQAFNDADLRALGRLHNTKEASAAFDVASNVFERVSFDLMYARQHQSIEDWKAELTQAVAMGIDHLSLYQLTIEEGTAFGDRYAQGKLNGLPDDDYAADMYEITQEICQEAGLAGYEVSNHARPGQESIHNLIYWRYGDYAGIGPGAHGRLTLEGSRVSTQTVLSPTGWLKAVSQTGSGESGRDRLSSDDQVTEFLLMGMRLSEGISLDRLCSLGGNKYINNIKALAENSFLVLQGDRAMISPKVKPVLNAILREILLD